MSSLSSNTAKQNTGPRSRPSPMEGPSHALTPHSKGCASSSLWIRANTLTLNQRPQVPNGQSDFPSVFWIADEHDLTHARELILKSHAAIVQSGRKKVVSRSESWAPEELFPEIEYMEGSARSVLVNAYERSRRARQVCIRHYGMSCVVCGFNFEATYGAAVAGYIQVHHIVPMSQVRQKYRLDPLKDLRPVCPNCHVVIHRREPPFTIEAVRQMLQKCRQHLVGERTLDERPSESWPR